MGEGARLAKAIAAAGVRRPCAVLDLEAFERNLARLMRPLHDGVTLRVASKSLRVPALIERVARAPGCRGVLAYHVREARLLADQGLDDLFVAYPPSPDDLAEYVALTSEGVRVWATVDHVEQVDALASAARDAGVEVELAVDIDLSLHRGPVHIGVRRSPLRSAEAVGALGRHVASTDGVKLTAVLAYEAQVAGVQDHTGGAVDLAMRVIKRRSRALALQRRADAVAALRAAGCTIEVVNGGGTGSVDFTAGDPSVTEVSAGSGLFCPHLFDGYAGLDLEPAAFFALSVVRSSDAGFVTCYGGGYPASGAAGADRLPKVHWPAGVRPLGLEGFGEVQTPMSVPTGVSLGWGDTVLCRHGKAGELCERFDELLVVRGDEVVERLPTYRALGVVA